MKYDYENVDLEIIEFYGEDVVTASCPDVKPDPVDCEWYIGA